MSQQWLTTKKKNVSLDSGLYVLRYESAADTRLPPIVKVVCDPGSNEIILDQNDRVPMLSGPGMSIVIRARRRGDLFIELTAAPGGRSTEATLKIEPLLYQSATAEPAAPAIAMARNAEAPRDIRPSFQRSPAARETPTTSTLSIKGHLSRRGDVTVGAGQWLGGPDAPTRIEGFEIHWNGANSNVELQYAALSEGQRPEDAEMATAGEFVGTRQQARAIVEAVLELTGPGADDHSLEVEYMFVGQSVRRASGRRIDLCGPTGREPLIGLCVSLNEARAAVASPVPALAKTAAVDRKRVRVFKA